MVRSRRRRKRCRYCHTLFFPDPRQDSARGSRQYACSALPCQTSRHRDNHQSWLKRHPDAYKGRYVNAKAWRAIIRAMGSRIERLIPNRRCGTMRSAKSGTGRARSSTPRYKTRYCTNPL